MSKTTFGVRDGPVQTRTIYKRLRLSKISTHVHVTKPQNRAHFFCISIYSDATLFTIQCTV